MNEIICGDSLQVLCTIADASIDCCVTDPPYELGFMGKSWDSTGIAYNVDLWREVLRVLKPGAHLLSFGGTRTYHRMACAIEDAGFEIRDQMQWLYGQGFPKSLNIGKAIDALQGTAREVVGRKDVGHDITSGGFRDAKVERKIMDVTKGASAWEGWGTALKPASEPICVARKPISEKTIAKNVLTHGTGALNIDACRIGFEEITTHAKRKGDSLTSVGTAEGYNGCEESAHQGRFPSNVLLDEEAAEMLDEQSGSLKSGALRGGGLRTTSNSLNTFPGEKLWRGPASEGGASRFFYVAKPSPSERRDNEHPTVKPIKLMEQLVRLICPPGGIVLDPFAGSGTTLVAAQGLGFGFVGIELSPEYTAIIERRLAVGAPTLVEGPNAAA